MSEEEQIQKPPEPPEIKRKFQFYLIQWIGVPLLMVIPILALFGVFGESFQKANASNAEFDMTVEYPSRFRYKMTNPVEVSLTNKSSRPIQNLTVDFEHSYISKFSEVQFTPQPKEVTGDSYKIELTEIMPGETRRVSASLQGEHYGSHQGFVRAKSESGSGSEVQMETFIFP